MVAAVVVVAAACSSPGNPISFTDQAALSDDGLSTVERNWLEGCQPALEEELADEAIRVCECSFDRIANEIPFDVFVAADELLRDNPAALAEATSTNAGANQIVDIVRGCIASV